VPPRDYSPKEAARALACGPQLVRRLCREGVFGYQLGRVWRIRPEDVERVRAEGTNKDGRAGEGEE
jgi:excisionase family DNA binding protein